MANKKVISDKRQVISKFHSKEIRRLLIFLVAALIVFLSLANIFLAARNEIAKYKRAPIEKEIIYWENVVSETPTYRDGYLKLATLYWQLGNDDQAKENLKRASLIDPNHEETKKLRELLGI